MDSPYQKYLTTTISAIQLATTLSRAVLVTLTTPSPSASPISTLKPDSSPVTIADLAIQTILTQVLLTVFPSHHLIAEESSTPLRSNPDLLATVHSLILTHARASPFCWENGCSALESDPNTILDVLDKANTPSIDPNVPTFVIDPIDGTAAFLQGQHYAINVALLHEGKQVASVVACPLMTPTLSTTPISDRDTAPEGSICYAVKGYGAWLRSVETVPTDEGTRLPRLDGKGKLVGVTSLRTGSGREDVHQRVSEEVGALWPGCDLIGWVPRWIVMARGMGNVVVWVYKKQGRRAKIWDHAGAVLCFEEVGGVVTDVNGREIEWKGRLLDGNEGFVAAVGDVHGTLLEKLREALKQ
ncbi:hypothetical protein OQA88_11511 [Cercophora sp. LCS_1]